MTIPAVRSISLQLELQTPDHPFPFNADEVVDRFRSTLAKRLAKNGLTVNWVEAGGTPPTLGLLIALEPGNQLMRWLVPFSARRSSPSPGTTPPCVIPSMPAARRTSAFSGAPLSACSRLPQTAPQARPPRCSSPTSPDCCFRNSALPHQQLVAARVNSVTRAHCFPLIISAVAIQLPPTATTPFVPRYSRKFPAFTPPAGMNFTPRCPYTPASAASIAGPPSCAAGKNFSTSTPASSAASTSLAVATPGTNAHPASAARATIRALNPGATPNIAPASRAASNSSARVTVPAPTMNSGNSRTIARIAPAAAPVRNVISATANPPARSASASGTASATSSITITGTIFAARNRSITASTSHLLSKTPPAFLPLAPTCARRRRRDHPSIEPAPAPRKHAAARLTTRH